MTLNAGTRLGPYVIHSALGVGGMGEVYRARDSHLNRDVAIKVLPEAFALDRDRLARFDREARMLAALNHPHIGTIYGVHESDGVRALVLELVEGATLHGPLRVPEALAVARQIVDALDAAHEKGIIHRDLKPANIKVTPTGAVKVLDFGLAKALDPSAHEMEADQGLTASAVETNTGAILGTPAYMSPEQARGALLDKRTDIWAFGCVLYELLTGRQPFRGGTVADTISSILSAEPDWSALPPETPAGVRRLLRRCLEKDTVRRLRDIGDARPEIENALAPGSENTPAIGGRSFLSKPISRIASIAVAAAVAVAVAIGFLAWTKNSPRQDLRVKHLALPLPSEHVLHEIGVPFALSHDGSKLIYAAGSYEVHQLFLKPLNGGDVISFPGTWPAMGPFFSPDDQWIGFKANGKLKKVPAGGGAVVPLCDVGEAYESTAMAWTPAGIFFSTGPSGSKGIARVAADGGKPEPVTEVRSGEIGHLWPDPLPDGRAILFTVLTSGQPMVSHTAVQSLATGVRKVVLQNASAARYVSSGHLIYASGTDIYAVAFDLRQLETSGSPIRLIEGISLGTRGIAPQLAVAEDGTLVYSTAVQTGGRSLAWADRRGVTTPLAAPARAYQYPSLSPDGQRIAVMVADGERRDAWVYRPGSDLNRLTSNGAVTNAIWTPDGAALTFGARDREKWSMFRQGLHGGASLIPLFTVPGAEGLWPGSWTSDAGTLIFMQLSVLGDLMSFPAGTKGQPQPFLQTEASEWGGRLSPDGRWVAYVSNDSDRWEVYIRPYPGPGNRAQVSVDGGTEAVWARSGRELFYRNQRKFFAADIQTSPVLEIGKRTELFDRPFVKGVPGVPGYDVSPDGLRFLVVKEEAEARSLNIVINWFEELKKVVPAR